MWYSINCFIRSLLIHKEDYELAIMTPPIKDAVKPSCEKYLGRHILAEFFECDPNILNNIELVERYMTEASVVLIFFLAFFTGHIITTPSVSIICIML